MIGVFCPINDALKAIFKKIEESDAIILGSPIYIGTVSGEMHSFMERLLFQYSEYSKETQSLFPKKIHTGFIYTMNATEENVKTVGWDRSIDFNEFMLKRIFGYSETLLSFNTSQFDDYSKVVSSSVDLASKAQTRKEQFPEGCNSAFEMGVRFARDKE
ncbi:MULTISPECIES: flavodoxin family protein [Clostridium]|uniref:NAD(P)H-dependent oxidoreductase n=1 Tax=Clostridium frigoriphilum TaxID=443253 RepID=A0ABU7UVL6_9CLOT|nr:NAD(P)H-dependent oxidoreductase [Clostridium sp. DSM 17811]MBU3102028.1 NAD(P)H-dependent oxidoreductase [Clostridium sp. DSM 17811]